MSKKNVFVIQSTAFVLSDGTPTVACALAAIRQHLEDLECAGISIEKLLPSDVDDHGDQDLGSYVPYEFDDHGHPQLDPTHNKSVTEILDEGVERRRRRRLVDCLRDTLGRSDYSEADVDMICDAVIYMESEQVTKSIAEQTKSNKTS